MSEPEPKPAVATGEPKPAVATREPKALPSEYHKARNKLMFWAGILFVWELVGINLQKVTSGDTGAIVGALQSPQAAPWALLALVGYSLFRLTLEWYQSSSARRSVLAARIDFFSSWFIAVLAIFLYLGQAMFRLQFANLSAWDRLALALGWILTAFIATFAVMIVIKIVKGQIDLRYLLNDRDSDES